MNVPIVDRLLKNREKSGLMEEVPGRCSRSSRPARDRIHPVRVSARSLGPVVGHEASPIRSWCDTRNLGIFVQKGPEVVSRGGFVFSQRESWAKSVRISVSDRCVTSSGTGRYAP